MEGSLDTGDELDALGGVGLYGMKPGYCWDHFTDPGGKKFKVCLDFNLEFVSTGGLPLEV
jgi:hypothetical protein